MTSMQWESIFEQAKSIGVSFILLAGGEPLIRRDVIEKASNIKDIIFPIFTNGTLVDEEYIKLLKVTEILYLYLVLMVTRSKTNKRRGEGTYELLVNTMDSLKSNGILYGASITVTSENIYNVTNNSFISELYNRGCKVIFFVEYVPVDTSTKVFGTYRQRTWLP